MIGRQVRLPMRVERAIDFTDALATVGGRQFVLTMSPDAIWTGVRPHTFVVLGFKTVPLGGRTVLPHLLLDDGEDSCPP